MKLGRVTSRKTPVYKINVRLSRTGQSSKFLLSQIIFLGKEVYSIQKKVSPLEILIP